MTAFSRPLLPNLLSFLVGIGSFFFSFPRRALAKQIFKYHFFGGCANNVAFQEPWIQGHSKFLLRPSDIICQRIGSNHNMFILAKEWVLDPPSLLGGKHTSVVHMAGHNPARHATACSHPKYKLHLTITRMKSCVWNTTLVRIASIVTLSHSYEFMVSSSRCNTRAYLWQTWVAKAKSE